MSLWLILIILTLLFVLTSILLISLYLKTKERSLIIFGIILALVAIFIFGTGASVIMALTNTIDAGLDTMGDKFPEVIEQMNNIG